MSQREKDDNERTRPGDQGGQGGRQGGQGGGGQQGGKQGGGGGQGGQGGSEGRQGGGGQGGQGAEVSRGAAVVVRSKPRGGQGRPPFPFHSDAMNLRSRDFNLLIRDQRAS
jgi:hypothetical protein